MTITGLASQTCSPASSICLCPVGERKWRSRTWEARCSGTRSCRLARISPLLCLVLNQLFPRPTIQHTWTSRRWCARRSRASSQRRILESASFHGIAFFCVLGSNTHGGAGGGAAGAPELVPTGGSWSPRAFAALLSFCARFLPPVCKDPECPQASSFTWSWNFFTCSAEIKRPK
jgi:hypothetical protein